MFFHSWSELGRIAATSAVLFVIVVAMLRVAGQQALAKMTGYDVVVNVTIGSILASVALTRDMTISDAVVALVVLIVLQELTRWAQARWLMLHHAVREAPYVVLWQGQLLEDRLRANSISGDEVRAAIRRAGFTSLSDVLIVVLENDGDWSVIRKHDGPSDETALHGLDIPTALSQDMHQEHSAIAGSPRRIP